MCVCVAVVASRFDERLFPLWSDCMKLRDVSLLEDCRRHLIALRAVVSCVTSILDVCLFVAVSPPFPCVVCLDGKEEHGRVPFPRCCNMFCDFLVAEGSLYMGIANL